MLRLPVTSSRIAEIGYDNVRSVLEIRFHDKRVLHYDHVPEIIFQNFSRVVSKGRFYDGVIKNKFPERLIR